MGKQSQREGILYDTSRGVFSNTPMNLFDRHYRWIMMVLGLSFINCATVSGYATFSGFRLYLQDAGDVGPMVNGTAVILTIAIVVILSVGWWLICTYGPEARTPIATAAMILLGAAFFTITLSVSSLPNTMALVGPSAKVAEWQMQYSRAMQYVNAIAERALGVAGQKASWDAEQNKLCRLADAELSGGTLSQTGSGQGPVAAAYIGACEQTGSFIASAEKAVSDTKAAVLEAQASLREARRAIRDRVRPVILREDDYLDAGERLNAAIQSIKAADLSLILTAGSEQVRKSVALLADNSSFSAKQVETVAATRQSLSGLADSAKEIAARWDAEPLPQYEPLNSPDFIAAIFTHWKKYIPAVAAAIGIDCFQVWALFFLLTSKAGKGRYRLKSDFEEFLDVDAFVPLTALQGDEGEPVLNPAARAKRRSLRQLFRSRRFN